MNAGEALFDTRALLAQIMHDVETGTGAYAGAIVTKEKMEPELLNSLRASVDDARAAVGLPRMFESLLADVRETRVSGATREQTLELIIDKLRSTTTRWEIREELPPLKQVVGGLEIPSAMESLRNDTLAQLQRNIDRLDGRLSDGFGTYPDYAELGKALANSELLLNVHRAGASGAAHGAETAATAAVETLAW